VSDERVRISSGSPFEPVMGYCRAVRVGDRVVVSGTAPQWPDGTVDPDAEAQTRRCLESVEAALAEAGASLRDVVRTRTYLVDAADLDAVARAHGAAFAGIRPANTTVVVAALLDPRWKVEVEVEAIVGPAPLAPVPEDWSRALAIVAHPDDLEYGSAAAVARWTRQGKDVRYLLATRGEAGIDGMHPDEAGPLREAEERAGAAQVGVSAVDFLDHRDGVIPSDLGLRRDLCRAVRAARPDVLLTIAYDLTWPGGNLNMADHRNVGVAVLDAARDAGNRWIFPELAEEGLEAWDGVRAVLVGGSPRATHAVDVAGTFDAGVASLRAHAAYLAGLGGGSMGGDPEPWLRAAAEAAGARAGCALAAAFEVVWI
jgi:LmbE family N-acetylglucosaminyl deacetylase/enamine deaminase RidA (YjgF/YER057c/UK114 family)